MKLFSVKRKVVLSSIPKTQRNRRSSKRLSTYEQFNKNDVQKMFESLNVKYNESLTPQKNFNQLYNKNKVIFKKAYFNVLQSTTMYSDKQGKRDFLSNSKLIKGLVLMGAPGSALLLSLRKLSLHIYKNIKCWQGKTLDKIQREHVDAFITELKKLNNKKYK